MSGRRRRARLLSRWPPSAAQTCDRLAKQAILQTKRRLPNRRVVVVADNGFWALELIAALRRVRLLHHQAAPGRQFVRASTEKRRKGQMGRQRASHRPQRRLLDSRDPESERAVCGRIWRLAGTSSLRYALMS